MLFTFQGPTPSGTAVAVAQKLGAIILVKLGKATESGQIVSFGPSKTFSEYPPITFTTRFKNTGNVHVKPRGSIIITNMFGKTVANVSVNENANNVLPNSERLFTSTWKDSFGFGRYTASEKLIYGDSGQVEMATTSFWVIPWKTSLIVVVVLFLSILILVWVMRIYNRWLLNKALNMRNRQRRSSKR